MVLCLLMPFSLVSLIFWACVRTVTTAIQAWWEVLMIIIGFCLNICSKFVIWALAILILPLRLFTALYREAELQEQLREMKVRLETLASENKELENCLLVAVKETNVVENVFQDIENEYEKAITKISLLENEVHDLKAQGKGLWDWKSSSERSGEGSLILPDMMVHGQPWGDDGRKGRWPLPRGDEESSSEEQKMIAFRRSVFSAALSLLVGLIIWEAGDPCMPLVAALFTVVAMSLCSVVHFFFTIKNRLASNAVVLLSINCFLLGTLSCSTLPRVLRMWGPWALRSADWLFCRLSLSS